jgi:hypothetical protein
MNKHLISWLVLTTFSLLPISNDQVAYRLWSPLSVIQKINSLLQYGSYANSSSEPQPSDTKHLPKAIIFMTGVSLIIFAIVFLLYCFNRDDYFMYIGTFGGMVPFIIGFLLILFCFLPDPPPIFGFVVGS